PWPGRRPITTPVPTLDTLLPFFFFMTRPPPRSTLFPYTTLFRTADRPPGPARPAMVQEPRLRTRHADRVWRQDPARRPRGHRAADRKSTRLNSSHVEISYAVFCLKKKNKTKRS